MINYLEYLNMPTKIGVAIILLFVVTQVIGEFLELVGYVVPEFAKIRKYFTRKNNEKKEYCETLRKVQTLLNDVHEHYSADNITKRDEWMTWVNDRATVYDKSVDELKALKDNLQVSNELILDLYINVNRNRIIDFASKIANEEAIVSREEFNRIFKIYHEYEETLKKYNKTNGEVDIAIRIIKESYGSHMRNHSFIEDIRGY